MRSPARSTAAIVLFVMALAACGGSKSSGSPESTPISVLEVAGPHPSASAQMVCSDDAKTEIAAAVGVDTVKVPVSKWTVSNHVYTCVYSYAGGATMTLSVKEMSSPAETTAYFDGLARTLGRTNEELSLGQGAFFTTNGSVVVRKDYRVMLVDVSHLPASFGNPPMPRASFANGAATTIMLCWTGA